MAQYLVVEKSFIDNRIVEEGATVEFSGEPGPNLQLVDAQATGKNKKGQDAPKPDSLV